LTEDPAGRIEEIDEDGQDVRLVVNLPGALCLIPYPPAVVNSHHGHLFATAEGTSDIFEIDPSATPTISTLMTAGAAPDGIAFSEDGATLYVACTGDFVVKGYDVSSGAQVWASPMVNSPPTRPDGIAVGIGSLSGYLYANYNNDNLGMHGTVWEFGLPGAHLGDDHVIVENGSRGDFIAVDPNVWSGGTFPSLLFTQSDRIMRLDPPGGGWFGPPTESTDGVLCTTCFTRFCEPGIDGVQGCPCSNPASGPGRGCNNFGSITGGAALDGSGSASLASDHVSLSVRDENASALTVFWTGTALVPPPGFALAAGVRCVSGNHRLYTGPASGGAITRPGAGDPSVSVRSAAVGVPISPGQTRYYFTVYRDPQASIPCGNSTSTVNVSNVVGVMWTP
jgi:DNA-binding beta-propeller fold protein YncE